MPNEMARIEITTVGDRQSPSMGRALLWAGLLILAVFVLLAIWPGLWILLVAALILAGLSTARLARHRALWEARFGQSAEGVGIRAFARFFAAWFFGILAVIPFVVLLILAGIIGIVIIVFVALLALITSLFSAE